MNHRRPVLIYALPNIFTSANLYCGFYAIYLAINQDFIPACYSIMLAGVFDQIDGRVARLTNTQSRFGVEFDSLCDLISFGLAPAILIQQMLLQEYDRIGFFTSFLFIVCAALRLARFNVTTEKLPKAYFQGLPVPMAAAVCVGGVFFNRATDWLTADTGLVLLFILSVLMVSTVRYPSFKDFHPRHRRAIPLVVLAIGAMGLVAVYPEMALFPILVAYLGWGVLAEVLRRVQYKKRQESL